MVNVDDQPAVFDPQFDADTGWAVARERAEVVIAYWRANGMLCQMHGCNRRARDVLCREHLAKITERWVPVRNDDDGHLLCGLCGMQVIRLYQNGQPRTRQWIIELPSHRDGQIHIIDGGFTVLTPDEARRHSHYPTAPPLFRTHPRHCDTVTRVIATGLVEPFAR